MRKSRHLDKHSRLTMAKFGYMTALGLVLTACAPNLGALPGFKSAADFASGKSFTADSQITWPQEDWWLVYGDSQLNGLMTEALAGAPDMAVAQARLKEANARAEQAGAAILPTVDLNASYESTKQSYHNGAPAAFVPQGWNDSARGTLDFTYELDFWGRNRAGLKAAVSEAEAAKAEAVVARVMLTASIAEAYADLAQNFADKAAAEDALRVRTKTSQLFAQRQANGLENIGSVKQAQALEANAKAEVAALDEAIGLTRNQLAALMGQGPDRGLAIEAPALDFKRSFGLPGDLSLDLLGHRADVQAARLRAESAAAKVKVAKAGFYPNVNLTGYLGQQVLGLEYLGQAGSNIGGFGPALNLPLFNRGQLKGQYRAAGAAYEEAVANYDSALTHAYQDVANVAVSRKQLDARLAFSAQAVSDAEKAWNVVHQRYRAGLSNYLDVLTAEDTLIQNRRALATLQARGFKLDVELMKALGGGYKPAEGADVKFAGNKE